MSVVVQLPRYGALPGVMAEASVAEHVAIHKRYAKRVRAEVPATRLAEPLDELIRGAVCGRLGLVTDEVRQVWSHKPSRSCSLWRDSGCGS